MRRGITRRRQNLYILWLGLGGCPCDQKWVSVAQFSTLVLLININCMAIRRHNTMIMIITTDIVKWMWKPSSYSHAVAPNISSCTTSQILSLCLLFCISALIYILHIRHHRSLAKLEFCLSSHVSRRWHNLEGLEGDWTGKVKSLQLNDGNLTDGLACWD